MHACDLRKFRLEMLDGAQVWILRAQIAESAPEQREKFRLVMVGLGAELDQLHEIGSGLGARKFLANSTEWIFQRHFRERVQIRFATARDLNFSFKEQIQLSGKPTFRATRAFRDSLNAA